MDVEGAELPILKTIPFDKVDIKVMSIEINHLGRVFPGSFEELHSYLTNQGYKLFTIVKEQDAIYVKNGFVSEFHDEK